jgi:hypothetical protein
VAEQGPWPTRVAVLQMHATVGLRKAVHNCHIHFKVGVRALQQHTASTLVPSWHCHVISACGCDWRKGQEGGQVLRSQTHLHWSMCLLMFPTHLRALPGR